MSVKYTFYLYNLEVINADTYYIINWSNDVCFDSSAFAT